MVGGALTKEDLRDRLLATGSYDLADRDDAARLTRNVEGLWRWTRSSLSKTIPSLRSAGPMTILAGVKFSNRQTLRLNMNEIMLALREGACVLFQGTGALQAAMAFGRQHVQERRALAHHLTLADVDVEPKKEVRTLGTNRGDLLVLSLHPVSEGKVWDSEARRFVAALRSHRGPTILISQSRDTPRGGVGRIAVEHFRPRARYQIGVKR